MLDEIRRRLRSGTFARAPSERKSPRTPLWQRGGWGDFGRLSGASTPVLRMKIVSSDFIRSCYQAEQFPRDRLPEVAFVGRSNVGKSSLINSLLNRKKLAKISRTPGKTRAINFFRVVARGRGRSAV